MAPVNSICFILLALLFTNGHGKLKRGHQSEAAEEETCKCPQTSKESACNVVILSATGRVGSSNLLSMLGTHQYIRDIGEIFIASKFRSQKLPPNINSPKTSPASPAHKKRITSHIKKHMFPDSDDVESTSFVHRVASVKFWHAWENGVEVGWMVKRLRSCG